MTVKNSLKNIVNFAFLLIILPFFIFYSILRVLGDKDGIFWAFSQFFSLFPGRMGSYLRKNFYRLSMTYCDKDCAIMFGTIFSQVDTEIGKGVYIGPNCNIGRCRIENDCTIGSNVHIMSGKAQHHFDDLNTPIQEQGGVFQKVSIGKDTWIGNCALIMADVGDKCIIGSGSVVTKDVETFSIVAGNPAKLIRKRVSD
jgi:acetyltransferase-like isoleucine patch superfamily enzyme